MRDGEFFRDSLSREKEFLIRDSAHGAILKAIAAIHKPTPTDSRKSNCRLDKISGQ
jgi:hypothetical protein